MRNLRLRVFLSIGVWTACACLFNAAAAQKSTSDRQAEAALQEAINKADFGGNLETAVQQYMQIAERYKGSPDVAAKALLRAGRAYQAMGQDGAQKVYELVITKYGDQREAVTEARARLKAMTLIPSAAPDATRSITEIWSAAERGLWEAVTPDGRYISDGGPNRLTLRDIVTKKERQIINAGNTGDRVEHIAFSADGKQVAYTWFDAASGLYELRTLPLDATVTAKPKVLLRGREYIVPFGWSKDGNVFAILTRQDRSSEIAELRAGSGAIRNLKDLEWRWPDKLSLSPDGQYVAYDAPVAKGLRDRDIFILSLDSGEITTVVEDPARDALPVWTPDGHAIVFASDRKGPVELWMVQIDDGKATGIPVGPVLENTGDLFPLGFSSDGSFFYSTATRHTGVFVIADGLEKRLGLSGRNSKPAFSPDGEFLAYFSQRGTAGYLNRQPSVNGDLTMVIRSLVSGDESEIPTPFTEVNGPSWLSDGKSLVFAGRSNGTPQPYTLHRIDRRTGTELLDRTIETDDGSMTCISPDGETIYYTRSAANKRRLMKYEIRAGRESELFANDSPGARFGDRCTVSNDSLRIAFTVFSGEPAQWTLQVVPASGGASKTLQLPIVNASLVSFDALQWSADQKDVLVEWQPTAILWLVPFDGGEPRRADAPRRLPIASIPSPIESIHRDGKQFAGTRKDDRWTVAVARGFLRDENSTDIFLAGMTPVGAKIRGPVVRLTASLVSSDYAPAWSPDGKLIAYKRKLTAAGGGIHDDTVVRSFETRVERVLVMAGLTRVLWFHDSKQFMRMGNYAGASRVNWETLATASTQWENRDFQEHKNWSFGALSPDDKDYYLPARNSGDVTAREGRTDEFDRIDVLDPFNGHLKWSFLVPGGASAVALSPDSRTLAIYATDDRNTMRGHVARIEVDGTGYRLLASFTGQNRQPATRPEWTKDGHILYTQTASDGKAQVMRIDAVNGKPEFTGLTIGGFAGMNVGPDGKHLVFSGEARSISLDVQ